MKRSATDSSSQSKRRNVGQVFKEEYSRIPGIGASKKGDVFAHCSYCNTDFTINHSGEWDIKRHCEREGHKKKQKGASGTSSIFQSLKKQGQQEDLAVTRAEAIFTNLLVHNNVPLAFATELTKAVKKAFPDSDIANRYACGRTKSSAIAIEMSQDVVQDIEEEMRNGPYCFATDGSNDARDKQFPIVVFTSSMGVRVRLLAVPTLSESATAENIFNMLKRELERRNVPLKNCLAFGTDSAAVMIGSKKGVYTRLKEMNPEMHLAACPCHPIHHAAERGVAAFPVKLDDVLVDIYFYLLHSSKRQQALETFQRIEGVEHLKILKHVQTRWLSIGRVVKRVLENWDALKDFVKAQKKDGEKNPRLDRLADIFGRPSRKLYFLFIQSVIDVFDVPVTQLQSDGPQIHKLRRILYKLLNDVLSKVVKPAVRYGKDIITIDLEDEANLQAPADMFVGSAVRDYLGNQDIRQSSIDEFFVSVKNFYIKAAIYIKRNLPLQCAVLNNAEVADLSRRTSATSFNNLDFFLKKYPILIPKDCSRDILEEQFRNYQSDPLEFLTAGEADISKQWLEIKNHKDSLGQQMYKELATAVLGLLTIPHSNAACERVFSQVRKNKTSQRASLGQKSLEAFMVVKGDQRKDSFTDEQLRRYKKATATALAKE